MIFRVFGGTCGALLAAAMFEEVISMVLGVPPDVSAADTVVGLSGIPFALLFGFVAGYLGTAVMQGRLRSRH